jgi:hypothetical protein
MSEPRNYPSRGLSLPRSLRIWLTLSLPLAFLCLLDFSVLKAQSAAEQPRVLTLPIHETFEDTNWTTHGWYDSPRIETATAEKAEGQRACVWHWRKKGDVLPGGKGGRILFEPTEHVTLSFAIKHSDNWTWTGVDWHPHEMHFMTTQDTPFWGPAYTYLTLYVEVVNGVPRLGMQDSRNIDTTARSQDLVGVTEKRAVAGGNGDPDGHGKGDLYRAGEGWRNGRDLSADKVYFSSEKGPYYEGDWHRVKAHFELNSIKDGKSMRDGVAQYWYDGKLLMDFHDVVFRTAANPDMKLNQFLMLPYYGPGVPHEQSIWVDDLEITK